MISLAPHKAIVELSVVTAAFLIAISLVSFIDDDDDDNDKSIANAQVVDVDEPPTNATEELDVKIDATEPLPTNGTIIADISQADDVDIDTIPPEGVSIVVTNSTVTVTNHPVEITEAGGTAAAATTTTTQEDTAGLDTGTSTASNNENEESGSASDGDVNDAGDGGSGEGDGSANTSGSNNEEDEEE